VSPSIVHVLLLRVCLRYILSGDKFKKLSNSYVIMLKYILVSTLRTINIDEHTLRYDTAPRAWHLACSDLYELYPSGVCLGTPKRSK